MWLYIHITGSQQAAQALFYVAVNPYIYGVAYGAVEIIFCIIDNYGGGITVIREIILWMIEMESIDDK